MTILINVLGLAAIFYLAIWVGGIVWDRYQTPERATRDRMQHEKRMMKRRLDKGYRV